MADDLQFERAETAGTAQSTTCAACKKPISDVYFAALGKVFCQSCRDRHVAGSQPQGSGFFRLVKASVLGMAGGLVGAFVWYLIEHFGHLQIGIVALLVGWLVSKGVLAGTGGVKGRGYQVLAVFLTYLAVALAYVPELMGAADMADKDVVTRTIISLVMCPVVPVLAPFEEGASGVLSAIILFFALYQAWKMLARRQVVLTGPHQLATSGAVSAPPALPVEPPALG